MVKTEGLRDVRIRVLLSVPMVSVHSSMTLIYEFEAFLGIHKMRNSNSSCSNSNVSYFPLWFWWSNFLNTDIKSSLSEVIVCHEFDQSHYENYEELLYGISSNFGSTIFEMFFIYDGFLLFWRMMSLLRLNYSAC